LLAKRRKLAEQVARSEKTYAESSISAERQRADSEAALGKAINRLEMVEQQRLAHYQTALGRYQRKMTQFGPTLTQMYQRHMAPLDSVAATAISADLR
uniref:Phage tail tape measure protein n=1 Tax=Plectus sambesii TaxID=2011161 RepID=A0A914VTR5_9BILA